MSFAPFFLAPAFLVLFSAAAVADETRRYEWLTAGEVSGELLMTVRDEDISAVRQPVAVFKGDRWFDPAQLYEALGIRPFTR